MKLIKENLLDIVNKKILRDENFNIALDITRKNSSGKIWLIGGFLYKTLVQELYGTCNKPTKDFDFLVEKRKMYENLILPEGYCATHSRFGGIKIKGKINADIINIEHFWPSAINFVEPTIENFLLYSPLNIQSIAYDVFENKVLGDAGKRAIKDKKISINNKDALDFCSRILRKHPFQIIEENARELGFSYSII